LTFALLTIGRAPDNDLSLQHPAISRHHLELRSAAEGLVVTDLGSVNGSFVNGTRVMPHSPTRLERGQALRVGPFFLVARRSPADVGDFGPPSRGNGSTHARALRSVAPDPIDFERALARRAAGHRPSVERTLPTRQYAGTPSRYLDYLPSIFAENDFLGRFLLIFERIWEPLEQRQDHMDMYIDPATCPESFLRWLASWFDVKVGPHWPEDRLRDLVGQAMHLYQWRGTRYGMQRSVELWTGVTPEIESDPSDPFVFTVRVKAPADRDIDRNMVEDLLRSNKPAHAGYVLEFVT
jgi:phage tail-like protein